MAANTSKRTSRRIVSLAGFGVLFLGFAALSLFPYWRQTSSLRGEINQLEQQIAQSQSQVGQLKTLQREAQMIHLEVRNYDRLVPGNQDLGPFLAQLSGELDNAGMKDITVRALPPITLGKCQQLPIEVRGVGSFSQFHDFLVRLERLPRMSAVSKMTIESDTGMTGKVTVDLTLSIYNTKPAS